MATYNGAEFIRLQLQTLAEQTLFPAELIVGDDGSTDGTAELVEEFARTAPFPVRLIKNSTRLGYGENFLSTATYAAGDLIAFCDQDDLWRPDKLARAAASLAETDAALYVHGALLVDENARAVSRFAQGITKRALYQPLTLGPWSVFYGFSMVFRREVLLCIDRSQRGAHTFEHHNQLSHDLWVVFLGTSLFTTLLDPEELVRYRQHGGNVTPQLTRYSFRRWTSSLGKAVDPRLPRHTIAFHRSDILRALSDRSRDSTLRAAALRAATYWQRIGDLEQQRLDIYRGTTSSRVMAWRSLMLAGGYRSRGSLGPGLAFKDGLAGVANVRRRH